MEPLYCVEIKLVFGNVVRAEYLTDPMMLADIKKQFKNNTILPDTPWEDPISDGEPWAARYVYRLIIQQKSY